MVLLGLIMDNQIVQKDPRGLTPSGAVGEYTLALTLAIFTMSCDYTLKMSNSAGECLSNEPIVCPYKIPWCQCQVYIYIIIYIYYFFYTR